MTKKNSTKWPHKVEGSVLPTSSVRAPMPAIAQPSKQGTVQVTSQSATGKPPAPKQETR